MIFFPEAENEATGMGDRNGGDPGLSGCEDRPGVCVAPDQKPIQEGTVLIPGVATDSLRVAKCQEEVELIMFLASN